MPTAIVGGRTYEEIAVTAAVTKPLPVNLSIPRTPTTTSVASSASSVLILAANVNRKGVLICNDSTAILRLSFSNPATTANAFVAIPAAGTFALDPSLLATGAIYGIWSAANGTAQVTEFV